MEKSAIIAWLAGVSGTLASILIGIVINTMIDYGDDIAELKGRALAHDEAHASLTRRLETLESYFPGRGHLTGGIGVQPGRGPR